MRTFVFCTTCALLLCLSCSRELVHTRRAFFSMDTYTQITLVINHGETAQYAWDAVDSLLRDWEERFSVTHAKSEVRKLNDRTTAAVPVSEQLGTMITTGLRYGDTLTGMFDLTILPVKEAWGLGEQDTSGQRPAPSPAALADSLAKVDYRSLRVRNDTVFFNTPATRIDVGGIAKGYVISAVSALLDTLGFGRHLISAGGDIMCKGVRADGKPWLIGIQHPRDRGSLLATVPLDSGAIVTSGDYERFRIINGKRVHHIFNPRTGYSCTANSSVTIMAPDPVEADIMSTGLFCRTAAEIIEFVNCRPRLAGVVVDSVGAVFISSNWIGKVKIEGNKETRKSQ